LEPRPYPAKVSFVLPIYNEAAMASILREALVAFLGEIQAEVEVILVNDGSFDTSLAQLVAWAREDSRVRVVHLSRNFGHQAAATAGLDVATGDAVILMDADLQDPLHVVHEMIARYREGYDVVYGQRLSRAGESRFKLLTAWAFYRFMRQWIHKDLPVDSGDFRLMSRPCLDALRQMKETHRFLRGMVTWLGYPQIAVLYQRDARAAGETKYPLRKMITFAWTAATSFSDLPLKFSLYFGSLGILLAMEESARALIAFLVGGHVVSGWTSIIILTSFMGGMILVCIGIMGDYIGKIYIESKDRPIYLIARQYHFDGNPAPPSRASHDSL
jgi:dolichol-phosphate mannosyltransferase